MEGGLDGPTSFLFSVITISRGRSIRGGCGGGSSSRSITLFLRCFFSSSETMRGTTPECDFLLLEVATVILVDEDEVEVILDTEFRLDVPVCRSEIELVEEETDGDALALYRSAIHDLELCECLTLGDEARRLAVGLALDEAEFHVLDAKTNEEEVDLADDDVPQVVL